ncbi:uncharacterized protein LOC133479173 [Phyllopteryx taeniolatus]|uniref:uncharacterized protein LOC133479173 n=1 Tax=Phyllopteryx taeniolatus TaxID=161469 RepID=UPI002AD42A75|nr:uncharacterized protein LOC133479173 [Phyllopteryx taeniolatus]
MNLCQNDSLRPEEAVVVENAIRLAIDSVVNVLYGVNSGRSREYQRMVAERDKEIVRLQREVYALRRRGCASCTLLSGSERDRGTPDRSPPGTGEHRDHDGGGDTDMDAGQQQQCELSFSLGLFDGPPSHIPSLALPSPPRSQTDPSGASEAGGVAVKEEPCNVDAVLVKWELSEEESSRERQEPTGGPPWDAEREFREAMACEEADGLARATEADQLRNKKKRVPTAELPEEAQQQKRAAWRAASRRYYARKVARQQAGPPSRHARFHRPPPNSRFPASHCGPFADDSGKRTPVCASPQDSQARQREAWRASSRRYYHARKMAHQQQHGPPQYRDAEPPGQDRGGLEGILCR